MLQMVWLPRSSFTSQPPATAPRIVNRRVSPPCSSARAYIPEDLYLASTWSVCKFDVTDGANALLFLRLLGEGTKSASPPRTPPAGRRRCGRRPLFGRVMRAVPQSVPLPAHRDPAHARPRRRGVASLAWPARRVLLPAHGRVPAHRECGPADDRPRQPTTDRPSGALARVSWNRSRLCRRQTTRAPRRRRGSG